MKLSEAMMLGATLRPQARGSFYSRRFFGLFGEKTSCALGAAYEAGNIQVVGFSPGAQTLDSRGSSTSTLAYQVPAEWWRIISATYVCPACPKILVGSEMIPHLNDHHRWSRQQIAEWVKLIEDGVLSTSDGAAAPERQQTLIQARS